MRRLGVGAVAIVCSTIGPRESAAQFTEPCAAACALTLGATAAAAATGTAVAVGRLSGGFSHTTPGALAWGAGFAVVVGAGIALQGEGARQERAVYAAAIGAAAVSLTSLGVAALNGGSDGAGLLASGLIGAAVGALAGGLYGALSHESGSPGVSLDYAITLGF
jgi:FtsH-binding integral membrane protein